MNWQWTDSSAATLRSFLEDTRLTIAFHDLAEVLPGAEPVRESHCGVERDQPFQRPLCKSTQQVERYTRDAILCARLNAKLADVGFPFIPPPSKEIFLF